MAHRRRVRLAIGVAVVALTIAACSSDSKTSTSSASSSGTATGNATCSGISLGFFGALTGASANLGINEHNGEKLAIDQFNTANPNCQVGFVEYDSQGAQDQAPALATKAVGDSKVIGIVGPAFSGESKTGDPIFDEAGLPIITASASNPKLSENGWKVFHRAIGNDNDQGPSAAAYIKNDLKAAKVAVIDDASEYGKGIADIVRTQLGSAVTVNDTIDPAATIFDSTVSKVNAGGVNAVFFGGYYAAAGLLQKQLYDAGVRAPFVAPDGSNDPGFIEAAGAAAEGAVLTAPAVPNDKISNGTQFLADYKKAYSKDAGLYSAEAFDAANFFLQGITAGNTTREKLLSYLNSGAEYKGLTKTYVFDDKGELAGDVIIWGYTVKSGAIVPLKDLTV